MSIKAPWTAEQVEALNAYQRLGYVHEFTCPNSHESKTLIAAPDGWHCLRCGYTQDWAHEHMADKELHPPDPMEFLRQKDES